jgi:hypothetical protein
MKVKRRLIQRENMGDTVNLHGCPQARIVYLHNR